MGTSVRPNRAQTLLCRRPLHGVALQAAVGLEALMKDLACSSSGAAAAAPRQLATAAGEGQEAGEAEVNPAAQLRLGSLADKVRQAVEGRHLQLG